MINQSKSVSLFSTLGCHLCEEAESLLRAPEAVNQLALLGLKWNKIDIADSEALFERYGVHIPVLQRPDGEELFWPFDLADLLKFLN